MKKHFLVIASTMIIASTFLTGCGESTTTSTSLTESKFVLSEDPTATFEQEILLDGTHVVIYLTNSGKGVYLADENGHTYNADECGGYGLENSSLDGHIQSCEAVVLANSKKVTVSAAGFKTS